MKPCHKIKKNGEGKKNDSLNIYLYIYIVQLKIFYFSNY